MLFVAPEGLVQLLSQTGIIYTNHHLPIGAQTAVVEVGRTEQGKASVGQEHLRMQKSILIEPQLCPVLQELPIIVLCGTPCDA